MRPRLPQEVESQGVELDPEGILFVGDQGCILAGFRGQNPRCFAAGRAVPLDLPVEQVPGVPRARHAPWLAACRGGDPSPGSFLNAGPITDAVNLATVALRAGREVHFDSEAAEITNAPEANRYLRRDYRPGWEL
jgi:hypothetical protein